MTVTFQLRNGDVVINPSTGRPVVISDTDKLKQDVFENLDSDVRPDGTGCALDGVITLLGDVYSLRAEINRRIVDAFNAMKAVQKNIQRSDRTLKETVSRVVRVIVTPVQSGNDVDPTTYAYRVDITSVSGDITTATGILRG